MQYSELKKTLKSHKLRVTDCRMDVLEFFMQQQRALSLRDLEDNLSNHDRVTLYRTLHSFSDNGLVHKIPDDSGFATYGLCKGCDAEEHNHNHMHFKCTDCGRLECIDQPIDIPAVRLPKAYKMQGMEVILSGVCGSCNA